jgi:hypothetical protein
MKALVYREYGSPDVLEVQEIERPTPKDDEVMVKVHAASVSSWDWDLLRGSPVFIRMEAPLKPKYKILGCDIAGRVEAVGKDVHQLHVGDELLGDISASGWLTWSAPNHDLPTPPVASHAYGPSDRVSQTTPSRWVWHATTRQRSSGLAFWSLDPAPRVVWPGRFELPTS